MVSWRSASWSSRIFSRWGSIGLPMVVGAVRVGLHRGLHGALRRHHDHGNGSVVLLARRLEQVHAAHAGHQQVREHDGRARGRDFLQRVLAVGRRLGREPPAFQQLLQADALRRVIFDHQDERIHSAYCGVRRRAKDFLSVSQLP